MLVVLVFRDDDLKHGLPVDLPFLGGVFHFGLTIHLGCSLDHVDLLIGAHAGDGTVVFDANQEPATISVGESGEGTGNASAVRDLELEIEHLVLALEDEVLNMVILLFHSGKDSVFFDVGERLY